MDDGDLVLAIISLIGLISTAAVIAVDYWHTRGDAADTQEASEIR